MLARDTKNLKKLKLIMRKEFALKQGLERIDWEEEVLLKAINDFMDRAQIPDPPAPRIVEWEDTTGYHCEEQPSDTGKDTK
jgi:hypothetical protein